MLSSPSSKTAQSSIKVAYPSSSAVQSVLPSNDGTTNNNSNKEYTIIRPNGGTDEWEIDCYSRPVIMPDGKKLWEILITDSNGSFQYRHILLSNQVNSKTLRTIIEDVIEMVDIKPNIR